MSNPEPWPSPRFIKAFQIAMGGLVLIAIGLAVLRIYTLEDSRPIDEEAVKRIQESNRPRVGQITEEERRLLNSVEVETDPATGESRIVPKRRPPPGKAPPP